MPQTSGRKRAGSQASPALAKRIRSHRVFYWMLLPALVYILVFAYAPMGGVVMAFKQFRFNTPSAWGDWPILRLFGQIANMEWVGLKWFQSLWSKSDFWNALGNTVFISFGRLVFEFPMPVLLALLLNEMRHLRLKRVYQTVYTFSHFLSWVLIVSLMRLLLQSDGTVNILIRSLGGRPVGFLTNPDIFRPMLYLSSIWKSVGWGSIIYLATISGIDPTLYEAATIDGASRWQCCWHITWPSIKPTVVIMLILQCGSILNAGFDQVFNLMNELTLAKGDIIDTYIYRYAFQKGQNLSLPVAAGLFKSVGNFALLLSANFLAKLAGEEGLM
ncbi:MAG: ABC transporter permease subunit [Candidatus Limiplasma sp.]|nr:ABC transporter permease subunit [Candidatus Limiplasma sp.]